MSIESDFVDALDAHAPLTALVGTRISKNVVDQSAARPLVVFNANHDTDRNLLGDTNATLCTFTVACWADDGESAADVADAVAAALDAYSDTQTLNHATVLSRASVYDEDLDLHGEVLTVEWWAT